MYDIRTYDGKDETLDVDGTSLNDGTVTIKEFIVGGSDYAPTLGINGHMKERTEGEGRWEFTWPTIGPLSDGSFILRGDGWDPEDGLLVGNSITWGIMSDDPLFPIMIPLGTGDILEALASQLSPGCQEITLTVVDSDGKEGTDTVQVDVGETYCFGAVFNDGFE